MAYNKSVDWYISRELRPLAKKIESAINKKGSLKVKGYVKKAKIYWDAPYYADFQDKGVKGNKSGKSNKRPPYRYKDKMPPPSAFERYTADPAGQFAIAKSIQKKGYKAKKYIDKTLGHYAPQVKRAIDRGVRNYTSKEVFNVK